MTQAFNAADLREHRCPCGRTIRGNSYFRHAHNCVEAPIEQALTPQDIDTLEQMLHGQWVRPLDLGGFEGSHHSHSLRRLLDRKCIERVRYSTLLTAQPSLRGSFRYRISPKGREVVAKLRNS